MPCLERATSADFHALASVMPENAHLRLGAYPTAVPTVRTWARVIVAGWGLAPVVHDAALVLTELTTNVVQHAGGPAFDVWLRSDRAALAIMVGDPSPAMPVRVEASDGLSGRGLIIVDAVARSWGAYRTPAGKITWALVTS
jgi:anti-sigma regulatory factor (Ser/Thr protein kinase)